MSLCLKLKFTKLKKNLRRKYKNVFLESLLCLHTSLLNLLFPSSLIYITIGHACQFLQIKISFEKCSHISL